MQIKVIAHIKYKILSSSIEIKIVPNTANHKYQIGRNCARKYKKLPSITDLENI